MTGSINWRADMGDDDARFSRREFATLSLAAGLTAATAIAAPNDIVDTDIVVPTTAGSCDAALVHPQGGGPWPAVILFTDVFGLRPTMRDMAKRMAANGYVVLIPNPYYRSSKAPGLPSNLDFSSPQDREKIAKIREPLTNDAISADTMAYVKYLDSQKVVNRRAKMGVFGYCMGGPFTILAAAANPERIVAAGSFHGGGLVTDKPDSPHLLIARTKAHYYFAIATNDDQRQPDAKVKLDAACKAAHLSASIEVYEGCLHGWCVKDMPTQGGQPIYNEAQAERAWAALTMLFKQARV
jgi:carboxymethylenebutenolidase